MKTDYERSIEREIMQMDVDAWNSAVRYVNARHKYLDLMLQARKGSKTYKRYKRLSDLCYMAYYRLDVMYGPTNRRGSSLARMNSVRLDYGMRLLSMNEVTNVHSLEAV
jgi:hypothetical protein